MADEQYRWLNRETAERLLRGESVEAVESVDASARDQAERLAGALGALSVPDVSADGELPGEATAVAAFRKAADGRAADAADRPVTDRDPSGDVGVIRIGGPARAGHGRTCSPWRRPARLGLAAALLFGSVGGAAALAVTGVIPVPFDDAGPGPAATVSAAVSPDRGPGSASPDGSATGGSGSSATGGASDGGDPDRDGASDGAEPGVTGQPGGKTGGWQGITAACRDLREGKDLGAGRKRALERAAGGASRVRTYCRGVLQSAGDGTGTSNGNANGGGNGNGNADGGGRDSGNGAGNGNGNGNGDAGGGQGGQGNQNGGGQGGDQNGNGGDDEGPIHEGRGRHRNRTAVTPSPAAFGPPESPSTPAPSGPRRTAHSALPSPDPVYSAL
jgi:hypothetical protein